MKTNRCHRTGARALGTLILVTVLVSAGVAGAAGARATGRQQAADQAARPTALIYGPVENELLEPIRQSMRLVPHTDGLQQLQQVDLVILDGDHFAPERLQHDELVATALRAGTWVLVLDVTEEHKRHGLGDLLLGATDGDDLAYLGHVALDEKNRPQVHIVGMKHPTGPVVDPGVPPAAADFVAAMLEHVSRSTPIASPPTVGADIPADLIYITYNFSQLYPEQTGPNIGFVQGDGSVQPAEAFQHPTVQVNAMITVFLDNQMSPQGDFQWIASEVDVFATPKGNNESFTNYRQDTINGFLVTPAGEYTELGWFQTRLTSTLTGPSTWVLQAASPETANNVSMITSGLSFQIGYTQDSGGSASFEYMSSTTRSIQDWKVTQDIQDTQVRWPYRTATPVDADQSDYFCREQTDLYSQVSCFPETLPNDLSISTLQLHTSTVWRTPAVEQGSTTLVSENDHEMVLLYCPEDAWSLIDTCTGPQQVVLSYPHSQQFSINPGAVLPVPITSLTFSPSPVTAGTQAVGTVTLQSPALLDTNIFLDSNSQNATVLSSVIVRQGQSSATFQVDTNNNGLDCNSNRDTTATINASNIGYEAQEQLQVQNTCPQ